MGCIAMQSRAFLPSMSLRIASIVFLLASSVFAASGVRPVPINELDIAGRKITDTKHGISFSLPEGWTLLSAVRRPNDDSSLAFRPRSFPAVAPVLYYSSIPADLTPESHADYFKKAAAEKEEQRRREGIRDYTNDADSMKARTIAGVPALVYRARYTSGGVKMEERIARLVGKRYIALCYLKCSAEAAEALQAEFEKLMETLVVP